MSTTMPTLQYRHEEPLGMTPLIWLVYLVGGFYLSLASTFPVHIWQVPCYFLVRPNIKISMTFKILETLTVPHNTTLIEAACLWWQASFCVLQNHWNGWKNTTENKAQNKNNATKSHLNFHSKFNNVINFHTIIIIISTVNINELTTKVYFKYSSGPAVYISVTGSNVKRSGLNTCIQTR